TTGTASATWAASTAAAQALRKASNPADRVASCWYGSSFTVDVNLTDGAAHRLAVYLLDWDSAGRSEKVEVIDPTNGGVLMSYTATNFSRGIYLSWTLTGHMQLRFTAL